MSAWDGARHSRVVDLFVLLHRDDGRVLLLRRCGGVYASGLLAPPSGHLEAGETVVEGALRETYEEVGVVVRERHLEFCHVIDHRSPEGQQRIGVAFRAERWQGAPYNKEPHKHSQLVWADPARPPADCVPYVSALLGQFVAGGLLSVDGYAQGSWGREGREGREGRSGGEVPEMRGGHEVRGGGEGRWAR